MRDLTIPDMCHDYDITILSSINQNRIAALDELFIGITDTVSYINISILLFLFIRSYLTKDKMMYTKGWIVLLSYSSAALISTLIKHILSRQRPFITHPFIEKLSTGGSPSFPSGHTTEVFAMATVISLCYPRWYIIVPLYTWAFAVGYSRLCLGVHYPSDVAAGIVVGITTSVTCYFLFKRFILNRKHAGISK